jgi:hypothetical protein
VITVSGHPVAEFPAHQLSPVLNFHEVWNNVNRCGKSWMLFNPGIWNAFKAVYTVGDLTDTESSTLFSVIETDSCWRIIASASIEVEVVG